MVSWLFMIATSQGILTETNHPTPIRLAAFGLGKLDEGESSSIAEHISSCEACRSLVEAVADDSLAGLFREANAQGTVARPEGMATGEAVPADPPSGYEVLEVVGEGGMGVVSKALQIGLGRLVALKQIRPEFLAGWDGVARFRRESEAAARLRHPNIVPIYDVGWWAGVPYYSMEYVEGGTLRDRLADGPIDPRASARLVETLARAVQHAHDAGVVHRDLKPGNVLLAPDLGCPKISDFGLAKLDNDASRTRSGAILGTPGYMAPEQAAGDSSRVGPSSDVYALGAILYEALTGRPPFQASTILETLELVRAAEPTPPRQLRGNIPRDLATVALKCLEKSPDRRYVSAGTLADDLRRHLDGEPIVARAVSTPERLAKWARRRPWQAISAALGVVVLLGAMAGTLAHNARLRLEVRRTEREASEARTQRTRAEDQYRSARDAIGRMLGRLDEPRFAGQPVGGQLGIRRQLVEDALAFYEGAVRDDGPAELSARIDKARALREAANYQIMLQDFEAAPRTLRRALGLLDALVADGRDDPRIADEQVECLSKLGITLTGSGRPEEAEVLYLRAIECAERAARSHPDSLDREEAIAWCHGNLGSSFLAADRVREAEFHLARAAEIRRRLLASHPREIDLQARLAEGLINQALNHVKMGRTEQADAEYAEAVDRLAPIVRNEPTRNVSALSLGKLYLNWGSLAMTTRQTDLAIERFRAGLETVDLLLGHLRDWPEARQWSSRLGAALGFALSAAGRYQAAIASFDRAIALAEGNDRETYRVGRLVCLAHDGRGDVALAEARAMFREWRVPRGIDLYNLACVAATVAGSAESPGSRGLAEDAGVQAIRWLDQAHALGTFPGLGMLRALDNDTDFDALRSREDFRLLRLDAAFPASPFATTR
jgi:eukaryotic-like serine/threonine-protein kinase